MIRYRSALAYFKKLCFSAYVILAARQQAWCTVERKTLSLGKIDNLFAIVDDFTTMFTKAKVAVILAAIAW
jgi:hypothetical protein